MGDATVNFRISVGGREEQRTGTVTGIRADANITDEEIRSAGRAIAAVLPSGATIVGDSFEYVETGSDTGNAGTTARRTAPYAAQLQGTPAVGAPQTGVPGTMAAQWEDPVTRTTYGIDPQGRLHRSQSGFWVPLNPSSAPVATAPTTGGTPQPAPQVDPAPDQPTPRSRRGQGGERRDNGHSATPTRDPFSGAGRRF